MFYAALIIWGIGAVGYLAFRIYLGIRKFQIRREREGQKGGDA